MRTLDNQTAQAPGFFADRRRDVRLLLRIAKMTLQYFTEGRRIRRAYREHERRGEVLWLDELGPSRHRDAHVTGER